MSKEIEISADVVLQIYTDKLANADREIVMLKAENLALRSLLAEKEKSNGKTRNVQSSD